MKRKLTVEGLEIRAMLSSTPGNVPDPTTTVSPTTTVTRSLVAQDPDNSRIVLTNQSSFTAEFTLHFNGGLSVNIHDLVDQIRTTPLANVAADVPDYERAYYYMMEFHQHDFALTGHTWLHEPSLYLNSLGAGLCDDAASALNLIWQAMGYESRVWLLTGHVVSEVHTGERWQAYDADLRVHYYNRDGLVAGVEELAVSPDLIYRPTDPVNSDPFVYRNRISRIYSSTEDNRICHACGDHIKSRDLIFSLPAGGQMEWGDLDASKPVPTPYLNSPEKLNLLRLTVPAGFEGTIDVPLMLYDVQGEPSDSIRLSNRNFQLGNNDLFDFFNVQDRIGNRVQSLSVSNNSAPIEISYLFNGELTKIQDQNTIEIGHLTASPADIAIELQGPVSRRWDLDGLQATKDFAFEGSQYVDLSSDRVSELFDGNDAFEMTARVRLNASDATRRPIADAYRFSLEVDAENRPYVYYRSVDKQWTSLRGPVLTTGEWHNIAVSYDAGKLTLAVDNSFYEMRVGQPLDSTYPQKGLFIGKSEHTGGLFFEGEMADFTMREITGSDHDRPQELVATVQLMNDAIGVQSTDDDDSEVPNAADPETFGFDWRRYLTALFTGSSRR